MNHFDRKSIGGYSWCPPFYDAADDMFVTWKALKSYGDVFALEAKHGIAVPPPQGPDAAGILMEVIL